MARFTPAQTAEIIETVTGECEAIERTNAWAYEFSPVANRRGRSVHDLMKRASAALGFEFTALTLDDVRELIGLTLDVVQAFDRRNGIAPLF